MVFSALAMARSEILWYFSHVGVVITRPKGTRVVPVDMVCRCVVILSKQEDLFRLRHMHDWDLPNLFTMVYVVHT